MAGESYYFVFSALAVALMLLHFINVAFYKRTNKTLFGEKVTPDKLGYKKYKNFISVRGITIATIVGVLFVVNLVYAINIVLSLNDPDYARFMLFYIPVAITAFFIVMINVVQIKSRIRR